MARVRSSKDGFAHWIELAPELAQVAQAQLREPASQEACIAKAEELLELIAAAGISTESGWFSYSPKGYAIMYLRWAKWDVPKALKRLKSMDKWHKDALPGEDTLAYRCSDFQAFFDLGMVRGLGRQAKTGGLINIMRPARTIGKLAKPNVLATPHILLQFNAWTLRHSLHDKNMHVHGMLMLETFEHLTFMDAWRWMRALNPVMSHMMKFNDCSPYRLQSLAMAYQPTFFSFLYAFAKPFMSNKMKSRMRLYGKDMQKLQAEIADASVLPVDFGGTNPDDGEAYFALAYAQEAEDDRMAAETILTAAGVSQ